MKIWIAQAEGQFHAALHGGGLLCNPAAQAPGDYDSKLVTAVEDTVTCTHCRNRLMLSVAIIGHKIDRLV